jgi:hypothetical protein
MKKIRVYIVAAAVSAFGIVGANVTPASASHRCGLGDNIVNAVCEGAHDIPQIILCKIAPKLCA